MALRVEIDNYGFAIYSIPLLEQKDCPPIGGSIGNKNWFAEHLETLAQKVRSNPGEINYISLICSGYGHPPFLVVKMTDLAEYDKIGE